MAAVGSDFGGLEGADAPISGGEVLHALRAARAHLDALAHELEGDPHGLVAHRAQLRRPGWMRPATGEERWPVTLAVAVAITLQFALPDRLSIGPHLLLPSLESALGVGLLLANPRKINRRSTALRGASVSLIALATIANGWSSYELVRELLSGQVGNRAGPLLATGASIYITNIILFGLWYWEWDRGGPVARAHGEREFPDLLFPQMGEHQLAPPDWRPTFVDYLYTSYTNATAFSPTDTMPLTRWTKMLFLCQSAIALVVAALVIARAVNIFR